MIRRAPDDRGSVVAEFAVAIPAVALVLLLASGALGVAARHVRVQDAAADAARLAARGEPAARVHEAVTSAVPGARAHRHDTGDRVCVTVSSDAPLAFTVTATGCALAGGW